ncbi:MAG: alanyl-tRNA synthetase [Anaerolineaceae bacterium]|nr:MAG: alanyl-tRNA synthetase [Anaerolineaceae bacterium]
MVSKFTGSEIRQTFIDFFVEQKHTFVPSASLVPGGDATLLFTNAGMVQFKDVFLGTDKRPYTRAVNSQKVLRVAGKHNDLDEVGRDDYHHTFFEMLGNWSFGDYYKKEAIAWAWQLLTEVWGLPREKLYATCFKDDKGNIPTDDEAAEVWKRQPGMDPSRILYFGRKENFWEMAETGPCGPCSEIHIDRGEEYDNLRGKPHRCGVNGECTRYLELWNNVFIQYNRTGPDSLDPLPATHVDTGMGFERIVAVLQGVDSDYKIDLFQGALEAVRALTGDSLEKMYANFTPYRVIADHARAAAFLIADGVVPGNVGRNYICRMIIRRAARFGTKLGLHEPFLAKAAEAIVNAYGDFYPELEKSRETILDNLTREEVRFARTVESGTAYLQNLLDGLKREGKKVLDGRKAFELYATYGLPLEISRDIAREQELDVDEAGFRAAMDEHRLASGGGKAMGKMGGEDAEFYAGIQKDLQSRGELPHGVEYDPYGVLDPYNGTTTIGKVLTLVVDGQSVNEAQIGDAVEVILPKTGFYIESGGQVSDTGLITAGDWEIEVTDLRRPSAGMIVYAGEVIRGKPRVGDTASAVVDAARHRDIMRNHTATHLMHAALHRVLGKHARQAGSLVAPSHLRFDFNHPEAMTPEQVEQVERIVNDAIAANLAVVSDIKSREEAISEGAMALFGEKYGEQVRTITIVPEEHAYEIEMGFEDAEADAFSYELCGGTHLERTADMGMFLIVSESSAAAGVRRIEAVTGRGAYELVAKRFKTLKQAAQVLKSGMDEIPTKIQALQTDLDISRKETSALRVKQAYDVFNVKMASVEHVMGIPVLAARIDDIDVDTQRLMTDKFKQTYSGGTVLLASVIGDKVNVIAAVSDDLVKRGLKAGDIITGIGGRGGGRPNMAQGSLPEPSMVDEALKKVVKVVEGKTK